jgi:hypothetical protein
MHTLVASQPRCVCARACVYGRGEDYQAIANIVSCPFHLLFTSCYDVPQVCRYFASAIKMESVCKVATEKSALCLAGHFAQISSISLLYHQVSLLIYF